MGIFLAMESYRLERLQIWRHPENYEKGYQTLQGLYAIGSGGLFGKGFGSSIQKLGFVPEAQNDMIFSIICEELGLVGASFVLLLFLILIWRFFCDSFTCTGSGGCIDCIRGNGTYDDTGNPEHCGGDEYDPEYRNNTSVYQLWRNFGYVPAF